MFATLNDLNVKSVSFIAVVTRQLIIQQFVFATF